MPDALSAHSVFLNAVRNGFFFPLKCNAFQAGFHGWLRGRGKRVRLSRSYYCAPLSQANLHINHRRPVYNQTYRSSRTPEIRPVCHSNNIIFVIRACVGFICSFQSMLWLFLHKDKSVLNLIHVYIYLNPDNVYTHKY